MFWRDLARAASLLIPAWWVWNPGQGGGGGGTVHTDGVTIQGDGSVGTPIALLDAMTDGATLQGAGIAADKLAVIPSSFYQQGFIQGNFGPSANTIWLNGFNLLGPLTFSNITIVVQDTDASNLYDVGIYTAAGALVAHAGAQAIPAGSVQTFAMIGAPITLPQGRYLFAFTGDGGNVSIYYTANMLTWFENVGYGASAGGVLPNTIAAPTPSPNNTAVCFCLF